MASKNQRKGGQMKLEARGPIGNVVEVYVVQGTGPGFFLRFQKRTGEKEPLLIAIGRYDKSRLHEGASDLPSGLLAQAQQLAAKRFQKTSRFCKHITGEQLPLL